MVAPTVPPRRVGRPRKRRGGAATGAPPAKRQLAQAAEISAPDNDAAQAAPADAAQAAPADTAQAAPADAADPVEDPPSENDSDQAELPPLDVVGPGSIFNPAPGTNQKTARRVNISSRGGRQPVGLVTGKRPPPAYITASPTERGTLRPTGELQMHAQQSA